MRRFFTCALAVSIAAASLVAYAQQPPAQRPPGPAQDLDALARSAIEDVMKALSEAMRHMPLYAAPTLNEQGDIIIRRLNPRTETPRALPPRRPPRDPDETST
jgi:hypothetical protein